MWTSHMFFFSSFVACFVQNVPRWNDSSLQAQRVAFICNWVSRKIACGLRSFFGVVNGQCRTNKLCRHNRRALEPLPPNTSWGFSFEKQIFFQSLHASVKDEETIMLNVDWDVSNSTFESLSSHQQYTFQTFCTNRSAEANWPLRWQTNMYSNASKQIFFFIMELKSTMLAGQ